MQSSRLYTLANLAFERGDYASAQKLANDAELTYQLETVQGFSLEAFIAKYGTTVLAALFAIMLLSGITFMGVRYYLLGQELSQLTNEEAIVVGLTKETQKDYFENGKMSTAEYALSVQQYDDRLGKIMQRKVELETLRNNYFNFGRRKDTLRMEKARLEQLMQALQAPSQVTRLVVGYSCKVAEELRRHALVRKPGNGVPGQIEGIEFNVCKRVEHVRVQRERRGRHSGRLVLRHQQRPLRPRWAGRCTAGAQREATSAPAREGRVR